MTKKNTKKRNILVVDDDPSIQQMLTILLESRGYQVTTATTGRDALETITSHFDLIILDLILPDMDGFEVCKQIKDKSDVCHVPIIMLSSRLLSEDIVEGLYMGADDYLVKPFEYEELVARMEAVIRRSSIFHLKSDKKASTVKDKILSELRDIIDKEKIVPFFQPIFLLKPYRLLGLEVLCRPKTEGILSNPEMLFKAALQYGFYHNLEMLSWRKALQYAAPFLSSEKLFLNCNPYLVEGPKFKKVRSVFKENAIETKNVVLEITERSAVTDFNNFYQQLEHYREYGFQFAVDDVGGGYASLESIVKTRPEVVKIDRHIVNDVEKDEFKKSIVRFIVSFCRENNIFSIAEGIETPEDLHTVLELGVDAAQGYLLYRPQPYIDLKEINSITATIKH